MLGVDDINKLQSDNKRLNDIIDSYQPRLQALKVEIAELQAYKDVNEDFKTAWEELKAENERLKARVKEIGEKMSFLNADRCSEIMRYKQTLQEIKAIVCGNYEIIDPQGRKDIIKLITKAEEEWKY